MITINQLIQKKRKKEKITCLTAYDASMAQMLDNNGIDIILVGDSLGMTVQGHTNTLKVNMQDMVYHTSCVSRVVKNAFILADMPFLSYHSKTIALENAGRLLQAGAQMVKLEGDLSIAPIIEHLQKNFIPTCAHIGLRPQQIQQLGNYKKQGKSSNEVEKILYDAQALVAAGASILLLENIYEDITNAIHSSNNAITIGIGAGAKPDGQVLVLYDILGISNHMPPFSKNFLAETGDIGFAIRAYASAVKSGLFPS